MTRLVTWVGSRRETAAAVAALCGLAILLTVHDQAWDGAFIYSAVAAGAARLQPHRAVVWLTAVIAVAVGVLVLDRGTGDPPAIVLLMALPGLGMVGHSRLLENNEGCVRPVRRWRDWLSRKSACASRETCTICWATACPSSC